MITRKSILVRQTPTKSSLPDNLLISWCVASVIMYKPSQFQFSHPPSPGVCLTYLLTPPSICSIYLLPPPSVLLIKTALKYHIQVLNYLFVCLSILLGDQRHFKTHCLDQKNTMLCQKDINYAVSNWKTADQMFIGPDDK